MRAIEGNAAELLMAMGAAGGGTQRDDAVRWTIGGSPIDYHNAVVAADLDDDTADQAIAESVAELRAHRVPGSWHVGPSMRPADLGDRLLTAGFTHGGTEPGMALDLTQVGGPTSASADSDALRITRVQSDEVLTTWAATLAQGFVPSTSASVSANTAKSTSTSGRLRAEVWGLATHIGGYPPRT